MGRLELARGGKDIPSKVNNICTSSGAMKDCGMFWKLLEVPSGWSPEVTGNEDVAQLPLWRNVQHLVVTAVPILLRRGWGRGESHRRTTNSDDLEAASCDSEEHSKLKAEPALFPFPEYLGHPLGYP